MKAVPYFNRSVGISIALLASLFIVLWGRPWDPIKALTSPGFYIALTTSFFIALLLVYFVHRTTLVLDTKVDWQERPWQRTYLQVGFGILLPVLVDLGLMFVFITLAGKKANWEKFILVDFIVVISFIVLLNAYYVIHYLVNVLREEKAKVNIVEEDTEDRQASILTINYNGAFAQLNVVTDVLYCYRSAKTVKVFTVAGHEYQVKDTIANLQERFKDEKLFQINPSVIINLHAVKGYQAGTKRDTLQVLFKPQHYTVIKNQDSDLFRITKDHIVSFKEHFEEVLV